jgi:DNA-binding CsgD family transcriptional regulator
LPGGKPGCRKSEETAADGDLEQPAGQQPAISYDKLAQVTSGCEDHFGTSSEDLLERPGSNNGSKGAFAQPLMTDRQRAVLLCLCEGDPNKVIGRKLGMTETTVKVHVREIMRKLGVVNRTQVAIVVGRNGLLVGNGDAVLAGQGQDVPALAPPRQPISETH